MASPLKPASRAPEIPPYLSPEVHGDGRVTLRYFHPAASAVCCEAEWNDWCPQALDRAPDGIWSCTSQSLAPDIYEYNLFADGARVIDYQNPAAKNRFTSFVQVPGSQPAFYDTQDTPHGTVHLHWYHSTVTGDPRRMHVYTPHGYETGTARYPVLYLLHGAGDDDEGWTRTGRANFIFDNLIATGQATPMVVAMPDGHVLGAPWKQDRSAKLRAFSADFHQHVMPLVESLYRITRDREHRAMAGLSMGGGQTVGAGMAHPGLFCAFGLFSSGLWPEITPLLDPALAALRESHPAIWIGIGRRDFLYPHCALLRSTLTGAGISFTFHEDGTAHSWRTWRDYLQRFAPLLFRQP